MTLEINAVVVEPHGVIHRVQIKDTLATYQNIVGGLIEGLYGHDATVYVNEEGLILGLPYNPGATRYINKMWGSRSLLYGTAVIVGPADREGNNTHVRPGVVDFYLLEDK